MRRAVAAVAALALLGLLTPPASAADLAGAQRRANAAAARLAAAETALAKAEAEVSRLKGQADAASTKLRAAESRVRTVAVRRYMDSGQQATQWLNETDMGQASRNQVLLKFVLVGNSDSVADYRTARADLDATRSAMAKRLADQQGAVRKLRQEQADINAELSRLAAAAKAEEARKRAAAAAAAARSKSAKGAAGAPAPRAGGVIVTGSWVCPVQGPHAFSNDFGQPRSGGRRHQGNDILSPRGTPVVANVGGVVSRHPNHLGGLSYYLHGADGNTYYGAHLQSYGAEGSVSVGTVIGYVGNSGDASGGPTHLHFEIHPGGGGAVNPYPTLVKYC